MIYPFFILGNNDMRQKRIKQATKEFLSSHGVICDIQKLKLNQEHVALEIGSGKGQFITEMAKDHPDTLFIAMEVNINVCYRILEKQLELELPNLLIVLGDANQLDQYFDHQTIDQIYLNFSDPWPKKKHFKRRLTAPSFLETYVKLLKNDGKIQFRTDHLDLFDYSIETIHGFFTIDSIDYHHPPSLYMTEYEVKKRQDGPIYQLIGKVEKHA